MFVDIAHFWWAVPFAVAGLPAFFALAYGVAAIAAWKIGTRGVAGAVIFALLWFLADYARGYMLTGFPWNLEGYAWGNVLPMLQITSVMGIYGLTLVTLLAACLPAILCVNTRRNRTIVMISLFVLVAIDGWGQARLANAPTDTMPNMRVRIVQPNIDQAEKWLEGNREKNFQDLIKLSSAPGEKPVNFIVWPETASTFYLLEDATRRHMIMDKLSQGTVLLTGVVRRAMDDEGHIVYYNSLVAINHDADIVAVYDKHHLVPYGEYVPFRSFMPMHSLVSFGADFSAGDKPHTLRVDTIPSFSPFICYEAIFSGQVTDPDVRPQMLLNITNDGWYRGTAGPYQHFSIARVRAIEEGIPLVRAANTGISGIVDAYGRVTTKIDIDSHAYDDGDIPRSLTATIPATEKSFILWTIVFFLFSGITIARLKKLN